jgi:hypothetical protein
LGRTRLEAAEVEGAVPLVRCASQDVTHARTHTHARTRTHARAHAHTHARTCTHARTHMLARATARAKAGAGAERCYTRPGRDDEG